MQQPCKKQPSIVNRAAAVQKAAQHSKPSRAVKSSSRFVKKMYSGKNVVKNCVVKMSHTIAGVAGEGEEGWRGGRLGGGGGGRGG